MFLVYRTERKDIYECGNHQQVKVKGLRIDGKFMIHEITDDRIKPKRVFVTDSILGLIFVRQISYWMSSSFSILPLPSFRLYSSSLIVTVGISIVPQLDEFGGFFVYLPETFKRGLSYSALENRQVILCPRRDGDIRNGDGVMVGYERKIISFQCPVYSSESTFQIIVNALQLPRVTHIPVASSRCLQFRGVVSFR